jgi:hypothetical protein
MRLVLRCLCGIALLVGGVGSANASGGSPSPAGAAKVYVVKGSVAQFISRAGTSVGSISIRIVHSSRSQKSLRGMLVTFAIDETTHVVGSVHVDATCTVRVRAASADDVPNSTALQVVVDSRDGPQGRGKGKGRKTPPPTTAKGPPADAGKPTDPPHAPPAHPTPAPTPPAHPTAGKSAGKGHP